MIRKQELAGVFARLDLPPSLSDLPHALQSASECSAVPTAEPFPSATNVGADVCESIKHISAAGIASSSYIAAALGSASGIETIEAIALALVAQAGIYLRNVVWAQIVESVTREDFAMSIVGKALHNHLSSPKDAPIPVPLLTDPTRLVCLPLRSEQISPERRLAIALFDLSILTLYENHACIIDETDLTRESIAAMLSQHVFDPPLSRSKPSPRHHPAAEAGKRGREVARRFGSFVCHLVPRMRHRIVRYLPLPSDTPHVSSPSPFCCCRPSPLPDSTRA